MSDQLDRRIRDLYAEISDAAPPLPPLPERVPAGGWLRRLPVIALAAAAAIAVVVATSGVLSLTVGSDDAGDAEAASDTTTTMAAVTTTSAADSGEAAGTTDAPGTTLSPVEALSLQCASFARTMEPALATATASAEDFEAALDDLEGELFGLRTVLLELSPESRAAAEEAISAVDMAISEARGGYSTVADELVTIDTALTDLAGVMTSFGADGCDALGDLLP